ncbi:hypothetical protein [Rhodopirellula sp. SWK7]|uniref:hypothetical protein n=1 Tax=Rhodopirellula sp. SWK7 TaxID=595460 RepID=UPI00034C0272|nr:hypothetical protein [Rhodopirellula sp. SWK7]
MRFRRSESALSVWDIETKFALDHRSFLLCPPILLDKTDGIVQCDRHGVHAPRILRRNEQDVEDSLEKLTHR